MKKTKCDFSLILKHRMGIWQPYRGDLIHMIDINGATVILNKVGALIWRLIDGTKSIREVSELAVKKNRDLKLKAHLSIDDVVVFIQYMNKNGWVSYGSDSTWNNTFLKDTDM